MLPSPATTRWSDSAALSEVFFPAQASASIAPSKAFPSGSRPRTPGVPERLGPDQFDHRVAREIVAGDQFHVTEAARIVEGDDRAVRHVKDYMVMRRELAARVMEFAGPLLVAAVQHAKRTRHAEMH